jgi:hypothetical protein
MGRLIALLMVPVAVFVASCDMFKTKSASAGIGQEVLDGKFAFIVTHAATSPTYGPTHAQGVYVIVSMAIRNVGTAAQPFDMAAQTLKDSAGRQYSAIFMDPPSLSDSTQINPGLQVSIKELYDVPPDVRPTQIVLHESASSPGVPVDLPHPLAPAPATPAAPASTFPAT